MTSPVYVALDTPDLARAQAVAAQVRGQVGGLKLGLEFFAANGPAGVRAVAETGLPIFLDLKLHDIPNTVARAVEALAPLRPSLLTIHANGGRAMMAAAVAAASAGTRIVAVTMLTSLDAADLADTGVGAATDEHVARLAALARDAGIHGIVCSGGEVAAVRAAWPEGVLVVPGLRLPEEPSGDQKRVFTPRAALDAGASVLVVGRPITAAADPVAAARAIAATL